MGDFNWVSERESCSVFEVFRTLAAEVETDVLTRQATIKAKKESFGLKMSELKSANRFTVLRYGNGDENNSVDFTLEGSTIFAKDGSGEFSLQATVTLNDQRECRLVFDGVELETWQFRRRSLEKLFRF